METDVYKAKQPGQVSGHATFLLIASRYVLEAPDALPPKRCITLRMSSTRASWLFVSQPEKLDETQRKSVEQICQGHLDLETAYQLGQGFVLMLAERRATDLDTWLTQAEHSDLPNSKKWRKGFASIM